MWGENEEGSEFDGHDSSSLSELGAPPRDREAAACLLPPLPVGGRRCKEALQFFGKITEGSLLHGKLKKNLEIEDLFGRTNCCKLDI